MSTTPHSPPETPLKPTMAADNENLTVKARSSDTPLNSDPKIPTAETPSKSIKQSRPTSEVQVPSTLPHDEHSDGPVEKFVPQVEHIRSDPSEAQTEVIEDDPEAETEEPEPDCNVELPEMDWADFENRYKEAMFKANDEEDKLIAEFEKYVEVFRIWSLATAQRDNDRGWKRLKTRQRYVQLAEVKLDDKKRHYEEVVQAFQKALELLRAPR